MKSRNASPSGRLRRLRIGGYSVAACALVLLIAVVLNVLVSALPSSLTHYDTTAEGYFSLSGQSEALLDSLEQDVTIYWIVQSGQEDSTLELFLERYCSRSSHLQLVRKDPQVNPTFARQYSDTVNSNSLVVEYGARYRYIDYYDIYLYSYSDYSTTYTQEVHFNAESELTSAIDYVLREELPVLYALTGHGESSLSSSFTAAIEKQNYDVRTLSLLSEPSVPADAACLLICAPQADLSQRETDQLTAYIDAGGSIFLITDPLSDGSSLSNLDSMMSAWGVSAVNGILLESDSSYYALGAPYYLLPELVSHEITSPLVLGSYYVMLPIAHGLRIGTAPEGVSIEPLLTSSAGSYLKTAGYSATVYDREADDLSGPFALAAAVSVTTGTTTGRLVWVSSAALVDDEVNSYVSGGNEDFFLNSLSWLSALEDGISIHSKSMNYEYLTMTENTRLRLSVLFVFLIPTAYLATGIVIVLRRRRK